MMLSIEGVLTPAEVADVVAALGRARFSQGRATAGWAARSVKANEQARDSEEIETLRELISSGFGAIPFSRWLPARKGSSVLCSRATGAGTPTVSTSTSR